MILEMVMESLFAVVDIYFVGKINEEAIGVVGLTESVMMIVYSLAIGLMTAAMAMVARRIGEKKSGRSICGSCSGHCNCFSSISDTWNLRRRICQGDTRIDGW